MLSDRDRQALNALEQQLAEDDPRFAEQLRQQPPASTQQWRWLYSTAIVIAAVLGLVLVLAGAPGTGFLLALLAVATGMARHAHYGGSEPGGSAR